MEKNTDNLLTLEEVPELYRKHLREIVSYIYSYVHNDDDAREMTQEVFYRVCEQIKKSGIDKSNFRAYLYKIARNFIIDTARKKKVVHVSFDDGDMPEETGRRSPEKRLMNGMLVEAVSVYINTRLSEKESAICRLRFYQNMNLEEIAGVMGSSIASISRVLQKVLAELEERFPDVLE